MKGKYITLQIRLACAKKPAVEKDIYQELEETMQERRRIMQQFIKPATCWTAVSRQKRLATMEGYYNHLSGQEFYPN